MAIVDSLDVSLRGFEMDGRNNDVFGTENIRSGVSIKRNLDFGTADFFGDIFDEVEGKEDGFRVKPGMTVGVSGVGLPRSRHSGQVARNDGGGVV